jgi:hypothetical protein
MNAGRLRYYISLGSIVERDCRAAARAACSVQGFVGIGRIHAMLEELAGQVPFLLGTAV